MRQRGFTLIETVLVLAVGIMMIISAMVFYMQSRFSAQVYETSRFISAVALNITEAGRRMGSYDTISLEYAQSADLIPSGYAYEFGVHHPFGGDLYINAETPTSMDEFENETIGDTVLVMTLTHLDRKACERLFGRSSQGVTGVIQARASEIRINGNSYYPGLDDPNHGLCEFEAGNIVDIVLGGGPGGSGTSSEEGGPIGVEG